MAKWHYYNFTLQNLPLDYFCARKGTEENSEFFLSGEQEMQLPSIQGDRMSL
jgi:hypothetical protein